MINKKNIFLTTLCFQLIFPIQSFAKEQVKQNLKSFEGRTIQKMEQIDEGMILMWSFGLDNSNKAGTFGKTIESINVISKMHGLNDDLRVLLADAYIGIAKKYNDAQLYNDSNDALERAEISLSNAKENNSIKEKKKLIINLMKLIPVAKSEIYLRDKNYQDAEDILNKAVAMNNSNEFAYLYLGAINYKTGRLEQSKELIQKAINLIPDKSLAYYRVAETFYTAHEYALAVENLHTSLILNPKMRKNVEKDFPDLKDNETFKALIN